MGDSLRRRKAIGLGLRPNATWAQIERAEQKRQAEKERNATSCADSGDAKKNN